LPAPFGGVNLTNLVRDRLVLTLLCLVLYLPGLAALPPTDRDESRFAQASRQMIASGDWVAPRFQDEPRAKKPIGIYWLQALAVLATGQSDRPVIWPYRLPSVLGAVAAVLVTHWIGLLLFDAATARLAGALLAVSALLVSEAHLATADAVLLAVVVAAQAALARLYTASVPTAFPLPSWEREAGGRVRVRALWEGRGVALTLWVAVGAGVLVKGPVAPLVAALTVISLRVADGRWIRGLGATWGPAVVLAMVAPWALAATMATGGEWLRGIAGDVLPKLAGGHESHGAPPGTYLALAALTFWPGSLMIGAGAWWAWTRRQEPATRFCLAWLAPAWLALELVPTKLPHYVLPLYPALALVTARAARVVAFSELPGFASRLLPAIWKALAIGCAVLVVAVPAFLHGRLDGWTLLPAAAAGFVAWIVPRLLEERRARTALWIAVAAAVPIFAPLASRVLPGLDPLWPSREVVRTLAREGGSSRPIATVGYREPSLVFLTDGRARPSDPEAAAAFLRDTPRAVALVDDRAEASFREAASRLVIGEIGRVRGVNASKGEWLQLILFELRKPRRAMPETASGAAKPDTRAPHERRTR
jgi:4-amino-4-deoxy-L-arabinose transferase-like glycosyltransferase